MPQTLSNDELKLTARIRTCRCGNKTRGSVHCSGVKESHH